MAGSRETATVDVLINGAQAAQTTKELVSGMRQLRAAMEKLPWDSPDYKKAQDALKSLGKQYDDVSGKVRQTALSMESMGKSFMSWGAGMLAGVASMETFKKAISTTDALSDKFEETISGLKFGVDAFFRALVTGNFSGFITNITEAVKLGKEYAKVMDEIEERTRAITIIESEQRIKIQDLIKVMRDQRLSNEERAKAAFQALKLESQLMQDKFSLAEKGFHMELKVAAQQAGISEASAANYLKQRNANAELINDSQEYLELKKEEAKWEQAKKDRIEGAVGELSKVQNKLKEFNTTTAVYATEVVAKMGKVSDEQLQKTTQAWVDLNDVQIDFREGTRKTWSSYTGLMADIKKEQDKEAEGSKKVKKEKEKEITQYELLSQAINEYVACLQEAIMNGDERTIPIYKEKIRLLVEQKEKIDQVIESTKKLEKLQPFTTTKSGMQLPGSQMSKVGNAPFADISSVDSMANAGNEPPPTPAEKAEEFINTYAGPVMDALSMIDQAMTDSENAQLARDMAINEEKKKNLEMRLKSGLISQREYNLEVAKLDADLAKKQRKIAHDQAVRQKELNLFSAIINTAAGMVRAFVDPGGTAGIALAALIAIMGGIQIAAIANAKVPQAAKGRYDVIGADDGKTYRNVGYSGAAKTGVYHGPTLVAEAGMPELIVDGPTTRNIQMNYPWIMNAISAARVRQAAGGLYPTGMNTAGTGAAVQVVTDPELTATLKGLSWWTERLYKEGVQAQMSYDEFTRVDDKINRIQRDASRD